jgi:hypothetical protein
MVRKDWTLLAVSLGGNKGLTPAQLQKVLFLLSKAYPKTISNYGPFDKAIYQDAKLLVDEGLIKTIEKNGNSWSYYCISSDGVDKAKLLLGDHSLRPAAYLNKLVHWAQTLTFEQLISSVYEKYPEYKVNSVFRG